jgi:hypothetical protein
VPVVQLSAEDEAVPGIVIQAKRPSTVVAVEHVRFADAPQTVGCLAREG